MAYTPRKAEVAAVVELLEGEHDSPEALARKLLRCAVGLMRDREWVALVNKPDPEGPLTLVYGPFQSLKEAREAGEAGRLMGVAEAYRLLSVTGVMSRSVTVPVAPLCACGHSEYTHDFPGTAKLGCVVVKPKRCKCKAFQPAVDAT